MPMDDNNTDKHKENTMTAVQKTVLASLLALSVGQAMAAHGIDVKVIGTIVPAPLD